MTRPRPGNEHYATGIYWLASYPKSGNTWLRAFIANLLSGDDQPVDINTLDTGAIASSSQWIEEALGFEISELSQDEIDCLRQYAYRWHARHISSPGYHKVHDAYIAMADGSPLFPPEATRGVLYIVRNPLDVSISLAHHNHCSIDAAINNMADPAYAFCGKTHKLHNQLRQKLLSWSGHVASWLDAPDIKRLVVRYEDMLFLPQQTFARVARFLELDEDTTAIERALRHCRMDLLQQQEREKGFKEKSQLAESFFRKGIAGDWVNTLTAEQVDAIIHDHGKVMRRLGYLDADATPVERFPEEAPICHAI